MSAKLYPDFSGGMNLFDPATNIADNQYSTAYNIRNREGCPKIIKLPVEDTTLPSGKKQGLYAFDKYLLAFVNGRAYYKNIETAGAWTLIADFVMSPTSELYYVCPVPASSFNYNRTLISSDQISGNATNQTIKSGENILDTSVGGLVVQDGVSQPWLIKADATARKLNNYDQWQYRLSSYPREYVPTGKQMAFVNGILFIVGLDGVSIYRSVSGRPLDFVVNVNTDSYKGGDADTTSYKVGYEQITHISGTESGELLVTTKKTLHFVEFDYNNTIFGEPTFLNRKVIHVGVNNHFSFSRKMKDGIPFYYFIDTDGLRMYSPMFNTPDFNEGRNSIFTSHLRSVMIDSDEKYLKQPSDTTSIVFDDYVLMSIKTNLDDDNNLVAIFDTIRQQWVCFDDYSLSANIKQFAIADQSENPVIYIIADNDKIYQLFTGTRAQGDIKLKAATSGLLDINLKCNDVYLTLIDGTLSGTISATQIVNGYTNKVLSNDIKGKIVENLRFNFIVQSAQGFTIQPQILWNTDHKLLAVQLNFEDKTQPTNISQQSRVYA
jgi:hypothetical protein